MLARMVCAEALVDAYHDLGSRIELFGERVSSVP